MAEVITRSNRRFYERVLDDMFKMRFRVLVEEWGWQIPSASGGVDIDDFDTDETVYIVELDLTRERVLACARLNPTTLPHMMNVLFADACDLHPIPEQESCWECSRFVVDRKAFSDPRKERETRRRVGVGITEFCLSNGVTQLSWFTHQAFYNEALKIWDTIPLGRPKFYENDNAVYIPAVSEIDAHALERQRNRLIDRTAEVTFQFSPLTAPNYVNSQNDEVTTC